MQSGKLEGLAEAQGNASARGGRIDFAQDKCSWGCSRLPTCWMVLRVSEEMQSLLSLTA
jgi:hypothetical protein